MGIKSKYNGPPPTRESFHLGVARGRFLRGDIDVEEFERQVEHVLRGGTLGLGGKRYPEEPMFDMPAMEAVQQ